MNADAALALLLWLLAGGSVVFAVVTLYALIAHRQWVGDHE